MTAMRIIDLQRRLREIGRIRTGDTTPTGNGKTRPRKLERFRLTSSDRRVIDAAADTWGGTVTPWAAPDGPQHQVYIEADEINVVVPPGDMSFSQAYEQWSAGGCRVRCDGQWDHIADKACHCNPADRDCNIHTRLSVMVPDLPGVGVWRLETHSYYAAVELGGLVDLAAGLAAQGTMLPARLRLEQRSVKRPDPTSGKVQTRRFAVPVLDLDVNPLALGTGGGGVAALPAASRPALTPVPEPERALRPSVAAQMAAVDEPSTKTRTAAPLPATGLRPKTVSERDAQQVTDAGGAADREEVAKGTASPTADVAPRGTPPASANRQPPPAPLTSRQIVEKAAVVWKDLYDQTPRGKKGKVVERLRYALTWVITGSEKTSTKDLSDEELVKLWYALDDLQTGRMTWEGDPLDDTAGVTFTRTGSGNTVTVTWSEFETTEETPHE